jgi:amino acid adenylation domain-containing protein
VSDAGFFLSVAQKHALGDPTQKSLPIVSVRLPLPDGFVEAQLTERLLAAHSRYDILRTGFVWPAGSTAVLQAPTAAPAPVVARYPEADFPAELAEEVAGEVTFGSGAPLRIAICGPDLILIAAAPVADERSLLLLGAELLSGEVAEADPLQFSDYVGWESEQLADDSADARIARGFWDGVVDTDALNDADVVNSDEFSPLPTRDTRAIAVHVDEALSAPVWLALWAAVRARYAAPDSDATLLAVLVSGRVDDDLTTAIGPYERFVPISVAHDSGISITTLADRMRADLSAAHRFAVHAPDVRVEAAFAERSSAALVLSRGAFPMELVVVDGRATLFYVEDVVGAAAARRLVDQLTVLAGQLDVPAATVDIRGEAERAEVARLLTGAGVAPRPASDSFVSVLDEHAARQPTAVAVAHGEENLTYAQLAEQTSSVASALSGVGVAAGSVVAVLANRSLDLIVGALGVLRAGGAYVALEPTSPPARIAEQLRLASVSVVLSDDPSFRVDDAAAGSDAPAAPVSVLNLGDAVHGQIAAASTPGPAAAAASESPAYLIFTSGSTGAPKPVVVSHGNVLAYVDAISDRMGLDSATRFASVTGLSTDLGNTAVFGALLSGGTLELVPTDAVADPKLLSELLGAHAVTALKITPSHLRALLADGASRLDLPLLVIGGERLDAELVASARAAGVGRVINHYGPTETTIGVLTYEVPAQPGPFIPIGSPLPHVRAYVLDPQGIPAPWGAIGQLAIGGAGVTQGYAGRAEETAQRFVPEPGHDGSSMYLTGDLVALDDSGSVVFHGRADGQIKVRGYRVELGEIESRLRQQDGISEAAVLAENDVLTGFVVASNDLDVDVVRRRLAQELPEFMVPHDLVVMDRIPRTSSGKLDRRRLLDSLNTPSAAPSVKEQPRTETEAALLEIWRDVLPVRDIGIHDNFFQIGGHSLIATRVIARARERFDVDIPLHVIFATSDIAGMAADIDGRRASTSSEADELASLLDQLESISDEEAARLLLAEGGRPADDM